MAKLIIDGEVVCGGGAGVIMLSQEDYDALSETQKRNGIYITPGSNNLTAKNLYYDGSVTGLGNNVQDAIDELSEQNKKIGVIGDLQNITDNFPYTVPKDGFLYISIIPESNVGASLYINGLFGDAIKARIITINGGSASGFYLCKKDDVLQIANQTNLKSNYIGFIPLA